MPDPKRIVESGYDAIADRFGAWQKRITGSTRLGKLDALLARLPDHPDVLELGSGAGVRSTRILAERGRLTGVDISAEQVRRARERVPAATFVHADFTEIDFEPASFDAVVALYVLNHVPHDDLRRLIGNVFAWLRPGGVFLATYGVADSHESVEDDWLGVPMFFSSLGADETCRVLRAAGFEIVVDEVETIQEPEQGAASFLWLLARRREIVDGT